jgi:hypothetical protein
LTTAYPALKFLVHHASFGHLLLVELYLSVLYSAYNGALIVYVTEIVPVEIRVCGFSLAYSLSQALLNSSSSAIRPRISGVILRPSALIMAPKNTPIYTQ